MKISDIKVRIGMAKPIFAHLRKILVNLSMGRATRVIVLKASACTVLLLGCEVWTISKGKRITIRYFTPSKKEHILVNTIRKWTHDQS